MKLLFFALLSAITLVACSKSTDEQQLVAVDVVAQPSLDPADDPVARQNAPKLVGVLPQNFPTDVELLLPASLIDFGESSAGHWISLLTPSDTESVHRSLISLLESTNWRVDGIKDASFTATKGGRRLEISIEDAQPGSRYRIDYSS